MSHAPWIEARSLKQSTLRRSVGASLVALGVALGGGVSVTAMNSAAAQTEAPSSNAAPVRSVETMTDDFETMLRARVTAERLMDMTVVTAQGETVGDVEDLLIAEDGSIDRAIVGAGGFLGLGERMVAIALDQMTLDAAEADELIVELTRSEIENLTAFEHTEEGWRRTENEDG